MNPIFISEFLPKQILDLCYSYSVIKYGNKRDTDVDGQTGSIIFEHGDYLMETLMQASLPDDRDWEKILK